MNRNIKLTIEYNGQHFSGWQIQKKGQRTVQDEIQNVLKKIFKEKIKLIGSGRTDSGVHALGQVANFSTPATMSTPRIVQALNANLPLDIGIIQAEKAPLDFHAQYSVKSKTYRYSILHRHSRSSLHSRFSLHYPYKLNISLMRKEVQVLIGRKDFRSFQGSNPTNRLKTDPKSTIRTIKSIKIYKKGYFLYIDIEANGFLYKMVRNIVGTLLEIGRGKLPKGSMRKILNKKDRVHAGGTAKAHGLALLQVQY